MTLRIIIRPLAYHELDDLAEYLSRSSPDSAYRLIEAAEQTFQELTQQPEIGSPCQLSNPRLQGLRCFPVKGFKNYLIFYRPIDGGVEILHVLHGARNIAAILKRG